MQDFGSSPNIPFDKTFDFEAAPTAQPPAAGAAGASESFNRRMTFAPVAKDLYSDTEYGALFLGRSRSSRVI
jgi:hypothetical protein